MFRDACSAIIDFVSTVACKWEWVFVISCIAVALDPLFLYIPIVNETNKCLAMDNKLRTTVLVFRSLTDFLLLSHIIAILFDWVDHYEISPESKPGFEKEFDTDMKDEDADYWFDVFSLTIKCLAILPIPQVAVLVGFFALKDTGFIALTTVLNFSLVLQYLPRIGQIYLNLSKFSMLGKWAKSTFLLFLYILAGHVLGALWYLFAIQRETSCWHEACIMTPGCKTTSFKCNGSSSTRNITILHQLCPVNSPSFNSTPFDFGMFAEILQSGNTGLVGFPTKFSYTLWWGLKNLSNFGTNIPTNSNPWENCFAILICVIGLLLFLYLMGNMQMHMQSSTDLRLRNEERIQKMIAENKKQIMLWIKNTSIPASEKIEFKTTLLACKVLEKKDMVDVDVCYFQKDPFPEYIINDVLEYLGMTQLKKVPQLERIMNETQLRDLARKMKPGVYQPNSTIIEPPQLVDQMFFIVSGEIVRTDLSMTLNATQYYGNGLHWAICNYTSRSCYAPLIRDNARLKSGTGQKLEVLTLGAWDLLRFLDDNITINVAMCKELRNDFGHYTRTHQPQDQPLHGAYIRWKCPPRGCLKLNCTAVYYPDTMLACHSFVLRNDTGGFMAASSNFDEQLWYFDSFHAGAQSIYKAMECIQRQFGSFDIFVESDDKDLIDWIRNVRDDASRGWQLSKITRTIIQACIEMIGKFKTIDFIHCHPLSNAAAVALAHAACSRARPGYYYWDTREVKPNELVEALNRDSPDLQKSSQEKNQEVVDIASASTAAESHATSTDAAAAAAAADDDICNTTVAEPSLEA